ncbi:MAG: acyltransferase [Chloroflexi bacterium]|nr:acyltransferase [Chloroflexota bacterium]
MGRSQRDQYIEHLGAIAIAWVIVVHVFYHKQFVPIDSLGQVFKTQMLFEMPLMFFVTGASLYYSHRHRSSVIGFLTRRFWRIAPPYLVLAALCSSFFYVNEWSAGRTLNADQILSWLRLHPENVVPVYTGWAMWFMPVIVSVSIAHVPLVRLFLSDRTRRTTAVLLVVGIIAASYAQWIAPGVFRKEAYPQLIFSQYTVFYSAFLYLGYYYASGKLRLKARQLVLSFVGAVALLIVLASAGIVSLNGQVNKFPPNTGYGLLGVGWLSLFLLFRPALEVMAIKSRQIGRLLQFVRAHSYTIFLYHGLAFWATDHLFDYLGITRLLENAHYTIWILVYLAFALQITALLTVTVDRLTHLALPAPKAPGPGHLPHSEGAPSHR